jgi:hypothetical protein
MYDFKTPAFPFSKPAAARAITAWEKLADRPKAIKATALPIVPAIRHGLKPIRSARRPHNIEEQN